MIAVACAALRSASEIWGSVAFTLTVGALFAALVGVIFRQRGSRAFWGGFALLGWGYLLLVFGPWFNENVRPQLLTTKLLDYLSPTLQRSVPAPRFVINMRGVATPLQPHFMQVGHSLWALILASAGGLLARYFYDKRARPKQNESAGI